MFVLIFKEDVTYNTDFGFLPQDPIPFYITVPNLIQGKGLVEGKDQGGEREE